MRESDFCSRVPETGLEPAHVTIPDPKSGASANFATPAKSNRENTRSANIVAGGNKYNKSEFKYYPIP